MAFAPWIIKISAWLSIYECCDKICLPQFGCTFLASYLIAIEIKRTREAANRED
jgi:hypothetical protein